MKRAILLSGGLDSIALCYWKRPDVAITVDYGQLAAAAEVQAAGVVARKLKIEHQILTVDCRSVGAGTMTRGSGQKWRIHGTQEEWWPYRNQLLITLAAARLVFRGVNYLLVGTVKSDHRHRDGRVDFFDRMDAVLSFQEGRMHVRAPAIRLTTFELIRRSRVPYELIAWAHSCHVGDFACGRCRGCRKHLDVRRQLVSA